MKLDLFYTMKVEEEIIGEMAGDDAVVLAINKFR